MKRFALMNLRNFGMGKKACEDKIIEECGPLIEVLKKFHGKCLFLIIFNINNVSNIFCSKKSSFNFYIISSNRSTNIFGKKKIVSTSLLQWKWKIQTLKCAQSIKAKSSPMKDICSSCFVFSRLLHCFPLVTSFMLFFILIRLICLVRLSFVFLFWKYKE